MLINLLVSVYLLNALVVALVLVSALLADRTTSKSDKTSWIVVALASILWFVAIPLSFAEVVRKVWVRRRFPYMNPASRHLS
ncbi:MAG: hypothetical protein Kow00121_17340 [Elainellaceae cyanobacterium]